MNNMSSKIVGCGLGLVVIIISGLATSRLGKPYNSAVFGLHKIVAVGIIILLVTIVRSLAKTVELHALAPVVFITTGLLFLGLFVSGALLALNIGPEAVLRVHQVLPLLAVGFSTLSVYLLVSSEAVARSGAIQ
jgi:hypothetical protein